MPRIYAIIRSNGTNHLRIVQDDYSLPSNVSDEKLSEYYNYAFSLSDAYCSCLPIISIIQVKNLTSSERNIRMEAIALQEARKDFLAKYDVVAMSHRYGGWTHIDWNFGENVSFHIYTNFGYGCQSVFNSTFKYKDIVLAPYSYYVKYKNSTFGTVVNCTNSYRLNYSEWENVMKDCLEFYNAIVNGKECYIFNWIENHLSEMVAGLEHFVESTGFSFYDECLNRHVTSHVTSMVTLTGDDFWIIKSEKIARSLEFVENIKVLPTQINPEKHIKGIFAVCEKFAVKLQEKINYTESLLSKEKETLKTLEGSNYYPLYVKIHNKYYYKKNWYLSSSHFKKIWFLMHFLKRINPVFYLKEIREQLTNLKRQIDEVAKQKTKVSTTEYLLKTLKADSNVMAEYMKKYM